MSITTEITEIRCYNHNLEGAPKLVLVFAFPSPENPTYNDLVGRTYSHACGRFAGVEYVVDAHGPYEDVTDWSGDCPAERNRPEDSGTWGRELAMEAGMLHGIDAYNDMIGC